MYLPDDEDELAKLPRQWIINICVTVLGDRFKDWVLDLCEERNLDRQNKKNLMIEMDPAMATKFKASSHVSSKLTCLILN